MRITLCIALSVIAAATLPASAAFIENTGAFAGTLRFEAEEYDARMSGFYGSGPEEITFRAIPSEMTPFPALYANASGEYMQARRDGGFTNTDIATAFDVGPTLTYQVTISTPGDWRVLTRFSGHSSGSDSFFLRIREDGDVYRYAAPNNDWRDSDFADSWRSLALKNESGSEVGVVENLAAGTYTIDIAMREDGLGLDQLLLITDDQNSVYGGASDANKAAIPFSIPEPATLMLLVVGGALATRRR